MELIDISKIKNKKILAIGAHPDDLEFTAGATIYLLAKENRVQISIVSDGRMGTHNALEDISALTQTRENETKDAAEVLGVKNITFWRYPDTQLLSYEKNFRRKLLKYLLKTRPDIIFCFDPWGRYEPLIHPDHRVVSWAVVESVLFGTLPLYVKKHGFGNAVLDPKPEIWLTVPGEASAAVDVTSSFPKKVEALKKHPSQFDKQVSFEAMIKRIEDRAKAAGEKVGLKLAEEFRILR